MTREEAITFLQGRIDMIDKYYPQIEDYREALVIAIQALEREPCEDAVSRQAVMNLIRGLTRWCVRSEDGRFNNVGLLYDDVMFGLDKLPPVTPQPKIGKWINGNPICPCCGEDKFKDLDADIWADWQPKYCPNCGTKMQEVKDE